MQGIVPTHEYSRMPRRHSDNSSKTIRTQNINSIKKLMYNLIYTNFFISEDVT